MDLMIEVTRRCNLRCSHCLRGEAENVDITKEIIEKIFQSINYIDVLMLTGGEPLLVPHVFDWIIEACEKYNVSYGDFWMATNGCLLNNKNFSKIVEMILKSECLEVSGLRISRTSYHGSIRSLPYPWHDSENIMTLFPWISYSENMGRIINEGRAKKLKIKKREIGGLPDLNSIYISANGKVWFEADRSFNYVDQHGYDIDLLPFIWEEKDNVEEVSELIERIEDEIRSNS